MADGSSLQGYAGAATGMAREGCDGRSRFALVPNKKGMA